MFLLASSSESRLRAQNIRVLTVFSRASTISETSAHSIRDFRQWKIALRFKSTKQPPDMRNADADGAQFGIQACQRRESVPPKKAFRHIPARYSRDRRAAENAIATPGLYMDTGWHFEPRGSRAGSSSSVVLALRTRQLAVA